jgi:hypothetical protein
MKSLVTVLILWVSIVGYSPFGFAQKILTAGEDLDGVKSLKATFSLGISEVVVKKVDDPHKAFTLNYDYSKSEKVPVFDYTIDEDVGVLRLANESHGSFPFFGLRGDKDSVCVGLATAIPVSLTMKFGVGDAIVDLGGVRVTDAYFSTGVCDFKLSFSSPNLVECNNLQIKTGISSTSVENLSNARAKYVEFDGGLGSMKINFGGKLECDCDVRIKSGLGSVEITIPATLNTTITAPGNLVNNVDVSGFYAQGNGVYRSDKKSGPLLRIKVESGMGSVTIKSY